MHGRKIPLRNAKPGRQTLGLGSKAAPIFASARSKERKRLMSSHSKPVIEA